MWGLTLTIVCQTSCRAFVVDVLLCCPCDSQVWKFVDPIYLQLHPYLVIACSVLPIMTSISTKPRHTSIFRPCMDTIKLHRIKFVSEMVGVLSYLMFLLRIGFSCCLLQSALCWCCSAGIIMSVDSSFFVFTCTNPSMQFIAKKLLEINERGTYENPAKLKSDDPESKAKLLAQEEEIFQIARLINASWFASGEYIPLVRMIGHWPKAQSGLLWLLLVYLGLGEGWEQLGVGSVWCKAYFTPKPDSRWHFTAGNENGGPFSIWTWKRQRLQRWGKTACFISLWGI